MVDGEPRMENSEQFLWLKKEIVPKIAQALDKDAGNIRCEIKVPTDSSFISAVYMVELISCCGVKTEDERIKLVVKMQPENEDVRAYYRTDFIFCNEIGFYQRFGKHYSDFPKCVSILPEPITRAAIVLENVTQFGYKVIQPFENLGMKRALAAFREIGKFHAQGYVLKEKNPEEFYGMVDELRENRFDDFAHPALVKFINTVSVRPLNYLRSVNYDPEFCEKISTFFSDAHKKILKDCIQPRNELAVLCHGDFTSSNVLLKEQDDGEFKAMLIDFALLRYSSPATDVSTFLYLSCEDEIRKNFPVIFRAYHDAILEYLEEHGIQDLERYSFDAFLKDYKRHAIIGCETAIYWIPHIRLDYQPDFDDIIKNSSSYMENLMISGGDAVSKRLADMLLELKNNGCLEHML